MSRLPPLRRLGSVAEDRVAVLQKGMDSDEGESSDLTSEHEPPYSGSE